MAANSEEVYLQGMFKYVRTPNLDQFGKWSCRCYPTPESLEVIRELQTKGLKNGMKKDEDGYNVGIACQPSKEMKGKVVTFPAPIVFDGSKPKDASGNYPLLTVPVGNGSTGIAKVEVYKHKVPNSNGTAVAWRWKSLLVTNLIPYTPAADFTDVEADAAAGLGDQKEQLF